MVIKLLLFASARDTAGVESMELEYTPETTIRALLANAVAQYPTFAEVVAAIEAKQYMLSVNLEYENNLDNIVNDGDEIGVIPPVSGG